MGGCITVQKSKGEDQYKYTIQSLSCKPMSNKSPVPCQRQNDMEMPIYVKNIKNRLPSSYKIDPLIGNGKNEKNDKKIRQIKSDEVPRKNRFQQKSINIELKQNQKEEEAAEQRLANSLIIIKLDEDEEEVKQVQTKFDRNRTTRNFQKETAITWETTPKSIPFCTMEERVDFKLPKRQPGPQKLRQFVSDDLQLRQTFMPIKIQNEEIQFKIKRYEAGLSVISEVSRKDQRTQGLQSGLRTSDVDRLSNKSTATATATAIRKIPIIIHEYTPRGNNNVNSSRFGPKLQLQNNCIPTLICE